MARPEKEAKVEEIAEKLKRADGVLLTDFRGLNVGQQRELRRKLSAEGIEFRVLKNTLVKLAAEKAGMGEMDEYLAGPTALAFGYEDGLTASRVLGDFAKVHQQLIVKAGMVAGVAYDSVAMKRLASLPPRDELLSRLVGSLQGPIAGLVATLGGPISGLTGTLTSIAAQKS